MDEKQALIELLDMFYESDGSLEWSFIEGTTIKDQNLALSEYLMKFIKSNSVIDGKCP